MSIVTFVLKILFHVVRNLKREIYVTLIRGGLRVGRSQCVRVCVRVRACFAHNYLLDAMKRGCKETLLMHLKAFGDLTLSC
jgi:hypothetical protein